MEQCASRYLPNFRHPAESQHIIVARVALALGQILRRFQLYSTLAIRHSTVHPASLSDKLAVTVRHRPCIYPNHASLYHLPDA